MDALQIRRIEKATNTIVELGVERIEIHCDPLGSSAYLMNESGTYRIYELGNWTGEAGFIFDIDGELLEVQEFTAWISDCIEVAAELVNG